MLNRLPKQISTPAHIRVAYFCALIVLAVLGIAGISAHAQYRATIQGVVTDPTGAVVPNARIVLTDTNTNATQDNKTDKHGYYLFNQLAADKFTLDVDATGFSHKKIGSITIIPEQPNTVNVKLDVGPASEAVSVDAGEVPGLDTATASISGTVTSNEIQHLPSFDRDVFRLVALAPGTFGDDAQSNGGNSKNMPGENMAGPTSTDGGIFKTENNPQVIGNGSQVNANNIMIDGIQTSSANWGGAIDAHEGVTFGGSELSGEGQFDPKAQDSIRLHGGRSEFTVPGYTAAYIEA